MLIINQTANVASISYERVENILHNELGMTKVSAQWMPRLMTADQKAHQTDHITSYDIKLEPAGFLESLLTQDEC